MNAVRWQQRVENLEWSLRRLREAAEQDPGRVSALGQDGLVRRFDRTFALAWKRLCDYLRYAGCASVEETRRRVFREAFSAGILTDGEVWMDMCTQRVQVSAPCEDAS